jgi:putative flippase GtrA
MIACATGLGIAPWRATAIGAACGGATNFFLGRSWIFAARGTSGGVQALRYALASCVGMCLNSGGVYLLHDRFHFAYVGARALVAFAVSLAWSFPVQRHFVFAHDSCFGSRP